MNITNSDKNFYKSFIKYFLPKNDLEDIFYNNAIKIINGKLIIMNHGIHSAH